MHPGTALDGCFAFFFCDDGVQGSIREWRVWGPLTHYVREEGSEQERRATSDERRGARGERMFIAKVIGNVVSTQKIAKFRGMKLLLVQPYINKEGKLQISGSSVVAVDGVGAGVGECVLFTQGSSARLTPTTKDAPVDAVIVGIVDTIEVDGAAVEKP